MQSIVESSLLVFLRVEIQHDDEKTQKRKEDETVFSFGQGRWSKRSKMEKAI